MSKNPTILFIHFGASSFVKEDLRILGTIGELKVFHFQASKSAFSLFKSFIQQFIWLLKNIRSADLIYSWFSDYHSFLPTLFSKWFSVSSFTVLGGFDCNKLESLNYGIFCSSWRAPLGKYVLRNSTLLLPVDKTLIQSHPVSKRWKEAHPNGVKKHVLNFETNWRDIPTGYDTNVWRPGPENRGKTICTVALCSNRRTALIKGWDLFIETSKLLPEYKFTIVGPSPDFVEELIKMYQPGANLDFISPVPRNELEAIYHNSSVYMQLSRAEGLPNVLCEAMMCGCVPVGSPVFGIPTGIGDTGYIAEDPDPYKITELIKQAHQNAGELRSKARQRIIDNFALQRRENNLRKILQEFEIINK